MKKPPLGGLSISYAGFPLTPYHLAGRSATLTDFLKTIVILIRIRWNMARGLYTD
jgi:hypothetical protein